MERMVANQPLGQTALTDKFRKDNSGASRELGGRTSV
jgi:hypothetical protein